MTAGAEFLDVSATQLLTALERIEVCVGKLTEEQIWQRHSENENAVGNLLLHLTGNVRQWILCGIGNAPDQRDRDSEFSARTGSNSAELTQGLRATVEQAVTVIRGVDPSRLVERIMPQGYNVTMLGAIYHVVEHFSGHTYQIIFITKLLTSQDMGFYAHLSGNRKEAGGTRP